MDPVVENVTYANERPVCVCGRSEDGFCNLNHLLSEEQYQANLQQEAASE